MAFLVGRECARVQGGVDAERAEEVRVAAEKPVALKCRGSGQGPAGEGRPGAAQVPAAGAGRARHGLGSVPPSTPAKASQTAPSVGDSSSTVGGRPAALY